VVPTEGTGREIADRTANHLVAIRRDELGCFEDVGSRAVTPFLHRDLRSTAVYRTAVSTCLDLSPNFRRRRETIDHDGHTELSQLACTAFCLASVASATRGFRPCIISIHENETFAASGRKNKKGTSYRCFRKIWMLCLTPMSQRFPIKAW